jgi:hypothetical protein
MLELSSVPAAATGSGKAPAILSLIGETPLVEITRIDTGPCQLFVKLENQNPTGSIKDRVALAMIEAAEREGKLRPGGTVIEATAGNTGLGLALVAGAKGYRVLLVIPSEVACRAVAICPAPQGKAKDHGSEKQTWMAPRYLRPNIWDTTARVPPKITGLARQSRPRTQRVGKM